MKKSLFIVLNMSLATILSANYGGAVMKEDKGIPEYTPYENAYNDAKGMCNGNEACMSEVIQECKTTKGYSTGCLGNMSHFAETYKDNNQKENPEYTPYENAYNDAKGMCGSNPKCIDSVMSECNTNRGYDIKCLESMNDFAKPYKEQKEPLNDSTLEELTDMAYKYCDTNKECAKSVAEQCYMNGGFNLNCVDNIKNKTLEELTVSYEEAYNDAKDICNGNKTCINEVIQECDTNGGFNLECINNIKDNTQEETLNDSRLEELTDMAYKYCDTNKECAESVAEQCYTNGGFNLECVDNIKNKTYEDNQPKENPEKTYNEEKFNIPENERVKIENTMKKDNNVQEGSEERDLNVIRYRQLGDKIRK